MKRLYSILLAFMLVPALVAAQNPRAVIKAMYKPESPESVKEKHDKAIKSNPGDEPAMQLMEALYLNFTNDPLNGYYQYCSSRAEIEGSSEVAKILKSLQLRLSDLFSSLESASATEVMRIGDGQTYEAFLAVAEANNHPSCDVVAKAYETKVFDDVMAGGDIDACNAFLERFPNARLEHTARVNGRKTDLIYREVSVSSDEKAIEQFLAQYPNYEQNAKLSSHLADLRYARVLESGDVEQMRLFLEQYPDHSGAVNIKKILSDKEYELLDRSDLLAVQAYVLTYPEGSHTSELRSYLKEETLILKADLSEVRAYLQETGYNSVYPRIVRSVARKQGAKGLEELMRLEDEMYAAGFAPSSPDSSVLRLNSSASVALCGPDSLHVLTRDGIAMSLKASVKNGRICAFNERYISTDRGIVDVTRWSVVGPDVYSDHSFQKEGLVPVCQKGLWGYLDEDMGELIAPAYKTCGDFCGGSALVQEEGAYALIDATGSKLFSAPYMQRLTFGGAARSAASHYAVYVFTASGGCGLVDSGGVVLLEPVAADSAGGYPAVSAEADGSIVYTRSGRAHRYNLAELLKKTTE